MTARRICTVEGCTRPVKARDRCQKHYDAARYRGDITAKDPADRSVPELLARLAFRLTARQLHYWIRRGIITPAQPSAGSGYPHRLTPAEAAAVEDVVTMTEQLAAGDYFRARRAHHETEHPARHTEEP